MKFASTLLLAALCAAATPALAAPATPPAPAPAVAIDDFGCMVRTMYMAGAAANAAQKATDQAARDGATQISTQNYEAASYFIGKLSARGPYPAAKQRFDGEVAALAKLENSAMADQIARCVGRAQSERAAFVNPFAGK